MGDRGQTSRERILLVAVEAIDRGGEHSLRVQEITSELGISLSSISHSFGSREGLVQEAHARRYTRNPATPMRDYGDAVYAANSKKEFRAVILRFHREAFLGRHQEDRWIRTGIIATMRTRPALRDKVLPELNAVVGLCEARSLRLRREAGFERTSKLRRWRPGRWARSSGMC